MKTATIEEITARVKARLQESGLAPQVRGVSVEPVGTYGDDEVLRVRIRLDHPERIVTKDASILIDQIVDDLWSIDDRFPSVRFDEAA